jgi:hypothetical protein
MRENIETSAGSTGVSSAERATKALASLPAGRGLKRLAAEVVVGQLIDELPLDQQERRAILPGSAPSLLNNFALLEHVPHAVRMNFFRQVIDRALSPGRREEVSFLAAVLTQAGYWLNPTERGKLLVELSNRKPNGSAAKCWLALALSAENIKQAQRILQRCGRERLLQSPSRELKDFVVTIEVMSRLGAIKLPNKPSTHATRPEMLQQRAEQLKEAVDEARRILGSMKWAKHTSAYSRCAAMLKTSSTLISNHLENAATPGARNRAIRADIERVGLEFRYGKSFTEEPARPWTEGDLKVVGSALEVTGEYRNLFSSVFEIKRVAVLEDSVGLISLCGTRIELEDRCFGIGKEFTLARGGISPEEVVEHELGHSHSWVPLDTMRRRIQREGGVNINEWFKTEIFPESLLRIGRWGGTINAVPPDASRVAIIGGKQVTLGALQEVDGEFRWHDYEPSTKCLYWYSIPRGEFPQRADSRSDPTEYFAEGMSDYYGSPESLIEHAPNLFWYYESIYHHYHRDPNVMGRLRERLKSESIPSVQEVPVEVDAFSLLQYSEQMQILENTGMSRRHWRKNQPSIPERQEVLLKGCGSKKKQKLVREELASALSSYNPALLLARAHLFAGSDVVIASIRGHNSAQGDTRDVLRSELLSILGPRMNRGNIILFGDPKSARYKSEEYHEKLVTFITERRVGKAIRADGQHKNLPKMYDQLVLYTDTQPTAAFVKGFAKRSDLADQIFVTSPRSIGSVKAAAKYLGTTPGEEGRGKRTLYIFTLEDVVDLPARFAVQLQGGRIMKKISFKEFQNHPTPRYWIRQVIQNNPQLCEDDLLFDDSELVAEGRFSDLLKDGRNVNDVPARLYVRLAGKCLMQLSLKEFLLDPEPKNWLKQVTRRNPQYNRDEIIFDDSAFTSEEKLLSQLKDGRDGAIMLKRLATPTS